MPSAKKPRSLFELMKTRGTQNPPILRKISLLVKPVSMMSPDEYFCHYYHLKMSTRETIRALTKNPGVTTKERFQFMIDNHRTMAGPLDYMLNHRGLINGLDAVGIPENATIVSYGAGLMQHESFLLKKYPQIKHFIGVESLDNFAKLTPKVCKSIMGNDWEKKITVKPGFFESSPEIKDASADGIISTEAFHHVVDIEKAAKNFHRVLKDNGFLVFVYRPLGRTDPPKPDEIQNVFSRAGFNLVRGEIMNHIPGDEGSTLYMMAFKKINSG
ncbi:MAG: methyltransferase domain-containing protein [Candidatus Diapherotrites archaeon]